MKKRIALLIIILISIVGVGVGSCYFYYRRPYKEKVDFYSQQYQIDPRLVYAVMKIESKFDPNAISSRGAKGLMQIMDKTGTWAAELIGLENYSNDKLFLPTTNIQIGTWYINRLLRQYDQDLEVALAAYNAGSGNVSKWQQNPNYSPDGKKLSLIPFQETAKYVKKVTFHYKMYQFLYPH